MRQSTIAISYLRRGKIKAGRSDQQSERLPTFSPWSTATTALALAPVLYGHYACDDARPLLGKCVVQ